ncbi:unnamed protein product [Oreochromis niloticus]|nr:unnamed protein product [Mustela putorius furo]
MSSSGVRREQYLLSIGVTRILDERYAELVSSVSVRQMFVTNLRNRPLSPSHVDSMENLVLSLYHNLVTGTKAFPYIAFRGFFNKLQLRTPFTHVPESQRENNTPSPPTDSPAGLMVLPAGSHLRSRLLTPLLPEKADLSVLKADRRNCVCTLHVDGRTITRVISTVYCTEEREMTNRWRVTDYTSDGRVIMSVLCQFLKRFTQGAKRKPAEEESSSRSPPPPRKRLRL